MQQFLIHVLHVSIVELTTTTRYPLEHNAAKYVMSEEIFDNKELILECMTSLLETNSKQNFIFCLFQKMIQFSLMIITANFVFDDI